MPIDFVYRSTLGLRVIKKKKVARNLGVCRVGEVDESLHLLLVVIGFAVWGLVEGVLGFEFWVFD